AMAREAGYPALADLEAVLLQKQEDLLEILETLLDALEYLKREVLLARENFPAVEEVFQKRHVAVDIPSVYGLYRERKFDALSLTFRLESLAQIHLEQLGSRLPEGFITRAAFFRIAKYFKLFLRALNLEGVFSRKLHTYLDILERSLEHKQFTYSQYVDVFRGFSEGIRDVVRNYYVSQHSVNLTIILPTLEAENLLPRYRRLWEGADLPNTFLRMQETFIRDLLASTLGLTTLDRFVTHVVTLLGRQKERLDSNDLNLLLSYDPANLFCPIHHPIARTRNLVHLGNKGYNLVLLADAHLPVPAGVILTTEYYRCQRVVQTYAPAQNDFLDQLREQVAVIEKRTGLGFGSRQRPLLLSVRSGALVSMPGMMQTIHNVGLNEDLVDGIIQETGNPYFAWDTYRRFIQSWCMTYNVNRSLFSQLMHNAKQTARVRVKRDLTPEAMEELARAYRATARQLDIDIPDDPWQQLLMAIEQVIHSWNLPKAREYRRLMGLSDQWGTAVVLQRMVFGNRNQVSGSGVVLTGHPHRRLNRLVLWGDYTIGNQGEDVVGGLVAVNPISVEQCRHDQRHPENSLERRFPEIYRRLFQIARILIYQKGWNPQEMEFTFDGPREENLHLLQTRDMMSGDRGLNLYQGFQVTPTLEASRLGRGIGVAGGVLCGEAVFNLEQIRRLQATEPQVPLILIRYDTVPEDITEIAETQGLLTARGGQTSHAAIVAARLNKVCVGGCEELLVRSDHGVLAGVTISPGDPISLDGFRGLVLQGWHQQVGKSQV
ncbi:MAG: phosphoenolpyruvate synthase, partial [Magnetococcales bacterium]|nr:phosphoenolpyruvate synthase [Magnetococcales bacterium]